MKYVYNDGGRRAAGYACKARDCAARSIAIVTGMAYADACALINRHAASERHSKRKKAKSSAQTGVYQPTMLKIMKELGWAWTPTMQIGSGCKVHLRENELPDGKLIVRVSRHYTAVIDGVINDIHDPQRLGVVCEDADKEDLNGSRCVYGYWRKA